MPELPKLILSLNDTIVVNLMDNEIRGKINLIGSDFIEIKWDSETIVRITKL